MNVSHAVGTSASLYPRPQSKRAKLDTQSPTASGQWTVCEPTSRLRPHDSRESERQELKEAAASGRLAFRRIQYTKEKDYFSGKGAPRPFTLALPGKMMPTEPISDGFGKWMPGIVNPQCLYVYKRDADTFFVQKGYNADKWLVKQLPDLQSLHDALLERTNKVVWGVYPRFTSGHLQKDGTFSLPKLKPGDKSHFQNYPELVLTNYQMEDVKCFCVYKDAQINISDILWHKNQCETLLNLGSLPLVVYCHRTGSVEVCFDDELESPHLASNENSLNDFAFSQGLSPEHLRAMLNLLPMPLRAKALSSESTISADPDAMHLLQEAIKLVSDPRHYSCERLLELEQSGLPIHQFFPHEGRVESLLGMLLVSELIRNDRPKHKQIQKQADEACRLCRLLLQSGARLEKNFPPIFNMDDCMHALMPLSIMNYVLPAFAPFDFLTLNHLRRLPLTGCPGNVIEFDRICRETTQQQRQSFLEKLIIHHVVNFNPPTLNTLQSLLLALFHYGVSLDNDVLNRLKVHHASGYENGEKIIDDLSLDDYIKWLENLRAQREKYPFYQNWPEHVRQAQREVKDLKQSLGLNDTGASATPLATELPAALQFVVDAFSTPPVLPDNVGDNEKTILKVLQHYYRRPGPERVIQCLVKQTMPTVWKPLHSCSHVLRARNNGLWYMELLEKFQQRFLRPQEKELLSLAIIYHDATAEDVDKSVEESSSAEYFKRDLAGHYPEKLLADMAKAIVSKENDVKGEEEQNLSEPVRWYLRILRFADRMDVIRGCGVGADFPGLTVTRPLGFDANRLDLPWQLTEEFSSEPDNKSEFQRHLEAAMHGAADLARVTGSLLDQRKKNYTQVYGLLDNGSKIFENFEWTTEPVQRMNQFIDDNVRRKIAQEAGIIVCSDPSHKACRADQNKGITYGIHNSGYDLGQVTIPAGMTLLEKMQYEHDPSLLSPATQQAIEQEVQRLKNEGIRMNPGTLTQETLHSEDAREVLKERGIAVVSEKRRYFNNNSFPREKEMLVPKKIAKLDAQSAPAEWACKIH
ncbi:hypothetical protein [Endozoicomonas sp. 8E]|uniref:hypothetical protein n=1 Tax=Endozoicomonas sp. 8E TaxID=3035692 RepID=UPI00293943B9|nr:hypothetical protein [Endozoicomonas sp. 8E]WOG29122.1 hypothetical protein P6910_05510 [Endozoicomonas sp. 8E]